MAFQGKGRAGIGAGSVSVENVYRLWKAQKRNPAHRRQALVNQRLLRRQSNGNNFAGGEATQWKTLIIFGRKRLGESFIGV
jgi:hypothetical protein